MHGARFYGFGSIWMPYQRRGEFLETVREIRVKHRYRDEFKWQNVGPRSVSAHKELIDVFFRTHWLAFHAIICPTTVVRRELHKSKQEMHQKHFTMLLTNKMRQCRLRHRNREHTFRVWVDPLPNSYSKANEVVANIGNSVLKPVFGEVRPIDGVTVMDSKDTPTIQLCDVLLGSAMAAWQGQTEAVSKLAIQKFVCGHLGWPSMKWDTPRNERMWVPEILARRFRKFWPVDLMPQVRLSRQGPSAWSASTARRG
jgi:hypothetical protein